MRQNFFKALKFCLLLEWVIVVLTPSDLYHGGNELRWDDDDDDDDNDDDVVHFVITNSLSWIYIVLADWSNWTHDLSLLKCSRLPLQYTTETVFVYSTPPIRSLFTVHHLDGLCWQQNNLIRYVKRHTWKSSDKAWWFMIKMQLVYILKYW